VATTSTAASTVVRRVTGHRLYTWVAVAAALTVFVGFARTYYLKAFYSTPTPGHPLSPLLHVHGLVMTAWFVLLLVQIRLVQVHRTDLHRRLGVAGVVLAALVVAVDTDVALRTAYSNFTANPTSTGPLAFFALSLNVLFLFALFVIGAILLRKRPDFHKRLMALAYLSILPPAIDRLPLILPFFSFLDRLSQWGLFGVWDLGAVTFIAVDTLRNRRLHPACIGGATLIVGLQIVTQLGRYTPAWQHFAAWLLK